MVLPKSELRDFADGLPLDKGESGPYDNAKAAESTIDPSDTAADIARSGRLTGHALACSDYRRLSGGEPGPAFVETQVEWFRNSDSAADWIDDRVAEFEHYEGKEVEEVRVANVKRFAVGDVDAADAVGMEAELRILGISAYATVVAFREDRIAASASMIRANGYAARGTVEELGARLKARIDAVLAGEISG